MRRLNSSKFRVEFAKLDEPVEITKYGGETVGFFYPVGMEPQESDTRTGTTVFERSVPPVVVTDTGGVPKVEFRPVPKPASRKRS